MKPRKPTQSEKKELLELILQENRNEEPLTEEESETYEDAIENASIAVFDHYITSSPGYAGKIMIVVWSSIPSLTNTYIWDRLHEKDKDNISVHDLYSWDKSEYPLKLHKVKIEAEEGTEDQLFTFEEIKIILKALIDTLKERADNTEPYRSIFFKFVRMFRMKGIPVEVVARNTTHH